MSFILYILEQFEIHTSKADGRNSSKLNHRNHSHIFSGHLFVIFYRYLQNFIIVRSFIPYSDLPLIRVC